ncbi:hypothetical protein PIB30_058036 [Stylosanthes scabra]|uniref:Uncharacterized protein n=1 Tax=Stylosanthes scabra TaxID=79078 RepID=A0ABU6VI86_9FABA|nr:hypothetical protein [Stylosanthes scabra]
MGSGVIYYEYEKREKFKDHDMDADTELETFRTRHYDFADESFVHPLYSVRFDPDHLYEILIEALMADKILSSSKDDKSSTKRPRSSRRPMPHYAPRTMPVAKRKCSASSVKGTHSFRRGTTCSLLKKPRSWELIPPSEGWMGTGGRGNPEDGIPATPSLPMDIDAEEYYQRYIEELGRAPEPSPLHCSQASVQDEPVEAADQQSVSRDGLSYNLSGVWQSQSSSLSSSSALHVRTIEA